MDRAGGHEAADVVNEGVGGRGGGGCATGGDDRGTAFANGLAERSLQPGAIGDDRGRGLAVDLRVGEGGEHARAVVTVDEDVGNFGEVHASFDCELALGAVLVEADHRGEAVGGQAFGLAGGDHAVRVGGIANHGDAGVSGGDGVDDLALADEDLAVVLEEVGAFHAGTAGLGTDEQAPVGVFETNLGLVGLDDALEEREGAIVEFHRDAFERFEGFLDGSFDELENDGLVGAEHSTGSDAEEEGVTDLAGGAGHCDTNG